MTPDWLWRIFAGATVVGGFFITGGLLYRFMSRPPSRPVGRFTQDAREEAGRMAPLFIRGGIALLLLGGIGWLVALLFD